MRVPPTDWVPPVKLCALAISPRSGSGMLADIIRTTGSLGRPEEWFNFAMPWAGDLAPNSTVQDRCWLILKKGTTANGVAGVKMFASQFIDVEKEIEFLSWFPTPHWIWLRRRGLLRQAISLSLAKQGDAWTSMQVRQCPVSYDSAQIRACMEEIVREEVLWTDYFAAKSTSPPVFGTRKSSGGSPPRSARSRSRWALS